MFKDELRPESNAASAAFAFLPDPDTEPFPVTPMQPDLAMEPESAAFLDLQFEGLAPSFDVQRGINAYLPLLRASYDFAHGNENPALPPGFTELGRVVVQQEAMLESAPFEPAVQAALANDFRALAQEAPPVAMEGVALESIAKPEAFGFVVREEATGAVIVSIRGTLTPEEWVKNFTAIPNPWNEVPGFGVVHLGFEQMWRRIRASVFAALDGVPTGTRITFLGHSLGGAMATLGAVDVNKNLGRTGVDLCTFGSPRTGKVRFRVNFNRLISNAFRVTNSRDIVPHVPSVLTAWNHVGLQIEVHSKVANAHSLESYLEGLRNIGDTREIQPGGAPSLESVASGPIRGARTL